MSPVRIVQVLGTSHGGVGRHVSELVTGLVGAGEQVAVAAPGEVLDRFTFSAHAVRAIPVEIRDRPHPTADARAVAQLRALARHADLLHAHGLRAGAFAALASWGIPRRRPGRRRPRLVVTLHNAPTGGRVIRVLSGLLERIIARRADAVLVVSGDLGARMRGLGARDVARALVPAPAGQRSERSIADLRRELGAHADPLIVTVGRLAPQKGLPLLVDALVELARLRPRLSPRAVIAGDGPLAGELRAEIARRGAPITLLGHRSDVPDLLAAADVVVIPSVWEGQPLIAQEALRAGAALVATDVGGTREVVEDGAILVPPGEPQAMAAAIAGLLDDDQIREALRARALAQADRLPSVADALVQVRSLYARLTGES